jgi:hypothetical protein
MPKLTLEPDSTGGERKKKDCGIIELGRIFDQTSKITDP